MLDDFYKIFHQPIQVNNTDKMNPKKHLIQTSH